MSMMSTKRKTAGKSGQGFMKVDEQYSEEDTYEDFDDGTPIEDLDAMQKLLRLERQWAEKYMITDDN